MVTLTGHNGVEDLVEGSAAVRDALVLRLEVVGVSAAAAVGEELAAAAPLVEVEARNVAGADALVLLLRARVCNWNKQVVAYFDKI